MAIFRSKQKGRKYSGRKYRYLMQTNANDAKRIARDWRDKGYGARVTKETGSGRVVWVTTSKL